MQPSTWQQAIESSAVPERAQRYGEKLAAASATPWWSQASAEQARLLAALFSGSTVLSELLIANPDWVGTATLDPEQLRYPRQKQGLWREIQTWLEPVFEIKDYAGALSRLRRFKQREMLRIAVRDLARLSTAPEITLEISQVADVCLACVYQVCQAQAVERWGHPYHQTASGQWEATLFCVIGLGKLGGQELNYSSDIDVIFVYAEEGGLFRRPPGKKDRPGSGLSNHQFFTRLAESLIAEVSKMTPDGTLFRIDLRLRPEGNAGPLVRSLASYENYYAQWGQTWERMMLLKARGVAGDAGLAGEFLETIQSFRYPRSLNERIFQEVGAMKERIETEVVRAGELDRNVKLGRGGIREIEFIVQSLQLLHVGRLPFLQESPTLKALQKFKSYGLLSETEVRDLTQAYCFLREVEHRLQMEGNQQTHTIPADGGARQRLAGLMGFASRAGFESALGQHTARVRAIFGRLFRAAKTAASQVLPADFKEARPAWLELLGQHSFREPERALRVLESLVQGPGYGHVSPRTAEMARALFPRLMAMCPKKGGEVQKLQSLLEIPPAGLPDGVSTRPRMNRVLSDPDRVLARLDSFVAAYGARSMLYEMWNSNPSLFDLLLLLFDRSEFLAEIAIRVPDLVDDLEQSGHLRRAKTAEDILRDLRHGAKDADQRLWIRQYHQAEFMRIGLRDILGLADFEQHLTELTSLADACLQYAMEVVSREVRSKNPPFAVIGLGKLGGAELTYGSDLDILFVANPKVKNLPALQKLAVKFMDLLSSQTEMGTAFATDARLRPDGDKGLLVNTLKAYEEYYRHRALLWEIQTLTRCRPVAGHQDVGARFQKIAAALTNFSHPSLPLSAYQSPWKREIARMRQRIEKERVAPGKEPLAFKTGAGGLVDAEFIAQTCCLACGWQEPNTLRALQRARAEHVIAADDANLLIENYSRLRRLEGILRRWSYEGESELPDDPAPLYRVAVRCGYPEAGAFMAVVKDCRHHIRQVYDRFMASA